MNQASKKKPYNRSAEHSALVNSLLLEIGLRDDLKAFKRDVGSGWSMSTQSYLIKYGRVGEADIEIILAPNGRVLFLEAKTGNAVQNTDQSNFEAYVTSVGAQYHVFRSLEEGLSIIENALR